MTTFPLIAIIAVAFTVLWLILFFKQTAKPMPKQDFPMGRHIPICEETGQARRGRANVAAGRRSLPHLDEPEDPFDVEYDPEEEARNDYSLARDDEQLRRIL